MKELKNSIIPYEEINAEAKRLGSIEELLNRAKEALGRSLMDINEPLSIVDADVFIEEARERLKQLTDSDEQKKYEAAIEEVDAMWKKKCDEV
ncbi:MAG: hypothetical protein WC618_05010, partial [Patescibacteria group bacterium]